MILKIVAGVTEEPYVEMASWISRFQKILTFPDIFYNMQFWQSLITRTSPPSVTLISKNW